MKLRDLDVPALLSRLGLRTERRGHELWARCPFHDERTPSFCVRNQPGNEEHHAMWRCYGACSEVRGGSVIGLVMALLDLDARAAWRWIGGEEALPVMCVEVEVRRSTEPFRLPAGVILAPLARWVTPAREYAESRGVTAEQADRWRLGYAVEGYLGGRLVLPVRDARHKLLGYTGRTFTGAAKKWREPRAEEGGDKGAIFGEEHWPALAERKRVVVTEAALDALAVERVLPGPVAAVYGSELLPGHVARLSTFAEVVVASDPDGAGVKLAKQIRSALARWSRVRVADLPDGYDPNALEREDPETLRRILAGLLS